VVGLIPESKRPQENVGHGLQSGADTVLRTHPLDHRSEGAVVDSVNLPAGVPMGVPREPRKAPENALGDFRLCDGVALAQPAALHPSLLRKGEVEFREGSRLSL
jgi:hypothetical protein